MKENAIVTKSYEFSLAVVNLIKASEYDKYNQALFLQFLRSSTSIGANVSESQDAQSRADFISKMTIALKEANESKYWLNLLHDSDIIKNDDYSVLNPMIEDIYRILSSIVKTTRDSA